MINHPGDQPCKFSSPSKTPRLPKHLQIADHVGQLLAMEASVPEKVSNGKRLELPTPDIGVVDHSDEFHDGSATSAVCRSCRLQLVV
jgi:hypothetical protein